MASVHDIDSMAWLVLRAVSRQIGGSRRDGREKRKKKKKRKQK